MKKSWSKSLATLVTLSMFSLLLAACSGSNSNNNTASSSNNTAAAKTTLKVYAQHFDDDTSKPFDYAVNELKVAMPNVEIILEPAVQDGNQKLKTFAATGNMPDIYETDWVTLQTFAKSKNVLLLDDQAETAAFKEKLNPGVEGRLVAPDGHVYAYPFTGIEFQILYYNKQIFKDAGIELPIKTIDQLAAAAEKLKAKGIIPLSIFAKEKWITTALYQGFVTREEASGYGKLEEVGTTQLSEPFITAAEQLKKLQQAGLFDVNATNTNYDQASSLFYTGKAAMFVNGQWEIYSSQEKLGDNVDWMYWPAKDEETYEKTKFVINGSPSPGGYAVSPATKDQELAVKVASFLAQKAAEYKYSQLGSPIVSVKIDKEVTAEVPAMMKRLAEEVLPNATGYATALNNVSIKNVLDDNTQNILVDGYSVEQFVKSLNLILSKQNK
ncbi:ABC transporter substrate-binding protein [Paenibacillus sp. FA6]|uniref:ABC transporter substrate-binding protein n=1 Tax=Paenibacillus sp. FA6 TaxID=3413029 RepID=UPI003F659B06